MGGQEVSKERKDGRWGFRTHKTRIDSKTDWMIAE